MSHDETRIESAAEQPRSSVRPTLKTIARLAGLGVTTVSRALHDAPDIGEETKARVRQLAQSLGYQPNRAGVRLRTGRSHVIALVLATESEELGINSQLIYGISEVLTATSYQLVVMLHDPAADPLGPIRNIVEAGAADGILFARIEPRDARVRFLTEHGVPFVTHGRTDMSIEHPYFDFDNDAYAESAVRRLASLGRRRLALLAPPLHLTYALHMTAGFHRGIVALGLERISVDTIDTDSPHELIQADVFRLIESGTRPDGFVCGSAVAALAVTAGAEAAGLVLGCDFDVVVKESSNLFRKFRPAIETAHEDFRAAGRWLAKTIVDRIEGTADASVHFLDVPRLAVPEQRETVVAGGA
ncbi:LacI family transcriptional regulator [Pleomorphomonas sp. PLEO]|uniref:LacI family transcriptional regulator n=1 Tax=Pleomorphomonas sp. PLEO TaxID=3239306 RepID=UPI00351F19A9